ALETGLDPDLKSWLAFAVQKMGELRTIGRALAEGRGAVQDELDASAAAMAARRVSPKIHDATVAARLSRVTPEMARRTFPFAERRRRQHAQLGLPPFPTTTIGSFPQTEAVRKARAAHQKGTMRDGDYDAFLHEQTKQALTWQEDIGLD